MSLYDELFAEYGELGERLASRMALVEEGLTSETRVNDLVVDPVTSHLAAAGGKRLRPALCLLAAELGPEPGNQKVIDSAVVLEMTHLASLYHDDVMDEAPRRRGVTSTQYIYGNSSAIMAGDVLFSRASILCAGLGDEAVRLHARSFERLCMGQLHETLGPQEGDNPIEHHIQVLADKTGSLIAASGRDGIRSSGGSVELANALEEFGERIGVAFQIADDIIDLSPNAEATGKTPGTDLLEGVPTMPTLLLRQAAKQGTIDTEGQEILDRLDRGDLAEGNNLAEVVAMLRNHAVFDETRELARIWVSEAIEFLDVVPESQVKEALIRFAWAMVERES